MTPQELLKTAISQGSFPKKLYKYRSITANTKDIFKNNELWFALPSDFNDPFDFKIIDQGNYTKNEIKTYLHSKGIDLSKADALADQWYLNPSGLETIIEGAKSSAFNRRGVLCLSKVPDNILMWSHYSNGHQGYVLGFDLEQDLDFFLTPLNVQYQSNYPAIQYLTKGSGEIVNSCMKTKHAGWFYEEEVRIVKLGSGLRNFKKDALVEIIFGCKISPTNMQLLKDLLQNYGYNKTVCYQATISSTGYKLNLVRV